MVNKYIITTAQYNVGVNKQLLRNMERYAAVNDAKILILPTTGKNVTDEPILAKELNNYEIVDSSIMLNKSVRIKDFGARPQQINPLTGLERFAQGDKSYIMPGTKQVLKYVANSYDHIPKAIMTTGAVTKPNYNLRHRTGRIAQGDHEYGFVVVEKERGHKYFHFRHVTALKNGNFTDVTGEYKGGKHYKKAPVKAMVIADLHPYDTNPVHEKQSLAQIKEFGGKMDLFMHDTFNGRSISHHYHGHNIRQHEVFNEQGMSLMNELKDTYKALLKYTDATKGNVYVVASNHDEHLYRYLDEGRFIGDKGNQLIGSQLYTQALLGNNPLEAGLAMVGDLPDNLVFLARDTGHKALGYELGNHGDLGANGGRGSPRSIEHDNAKSITAHGHSAFKIRNTYRVGTSTHLRVDYNRGYSNWTNTNAVLYQNGTVQLLNTINKKWRG